MVFYFTSTGNCLYVAREFDTKAKSIPQEKLGQKYQDESIGVVCPVYWNDVPPIVAEFLRKATRYINLYDLTFMGCHGCLACKSKGVENPCHCYWKDELSPVLDEILQANHLVIGSPIYLENVTGAFRSLMERLCFPALSYETLASDYNGKIDVDIVLDMGVTKDTYERSYQKRIEEEMIFFQLLNGTVKIHPFCDTMQVKDASKYYMAGIDTDSKRERHDKRFSEELARAYAIGKRVNYILNDKKVPFTELSVKGTFLSFINLNFIFISQAHR